VAALSSRLLSAPSPLGVLPHSIFTLLIRHRQQLPAICLFLRSLRHAALVIATALHRHSLSWGRGPLRQVGPFSIAFRIRGRFPIAGRMPNLASKNAAIRTFRLSPCRLGAHSFHLAFKPYQNCLSSVRWSTFQKQACASFCSSHALCLLRTFACMTLYSFQGASSRCRPSTSGLRRTLERMSLLRQLSQAIKINLGPRRGVAEWHMATNTDLWP
jgi:hypothetical protein